MIQLCAIWQIAENIYFVCCRFHNKIIIRLRLRCHIFIQGMICPEIWISYIPCNANQSGIFMPVVPHGCHIHKGQTLGVIADSLTGKVREELRSPIEGLLFTLREYPVVLEGSLIARVLEV